MASPTLPCLGPNSYSSSSSVNELMGSPASASSQLPEVQTKAAYTPRRLVKKTSGSYRSSFMDFGADPSELSFKSLLESIDALPKAESLPIQPSTTVMTSTTTSNNQSCTASDPPQNISHVNTLSNFPKQIHHRVLYYCSSLVPARTASKTFSLWSAIRIKRQQQQRRRTRTASIAVIASSGGAAVSKLRRRKEAGKAKKKDDSVSLYQLERVIQEATLRDGLADRLLQEHRRDSCLSLRFVTAVTDYERTQGWKKRYDKGRKIISLFVARNAKFQISRLRNGRSESLFRAEIVRRGRFSQYTYLVKLKSCVMLDLVNDSVVKQYLGELRELSFASRCFVDSNEMEIDGDDANENYYDDEMEIEIA